MLPKDKHAVIYGGAGAIGGAVARAFAAEGATVHLVGRTREPLDDVAGKIAHMRDETMLGRLPTLTELGDAATFLASDRASAMTATLANVTCGAFLD